ncbi:MAG: dodecin family protein [Alphaproteobacteria bacterium]
MSVYKVIELIGTSPDSWEEAAKEAVSRAGRSVRDLRVAEVNEMDMVVDRDGGVELFRCKLKVSFKHDGD